MVHGLKTKNRVARVRRADLSVSNGLLRTALGASSRALAAMSLRCQDPDCRDRQLSRS